MSITILLAFAFSLMLLVVLVRSLRLPTDHYENRKKREKLRRMVMKHHINFPSDNKASSTEDTSSSGTSSDQVN